jgi:hypothetical protein
MSETPQTPVPERGPETVFAYRGQELHGVPQVGTPDLYDEVPAGESVLVHELPPEPDPIPVRIVRGGGRELARWRTLRAYAGDDVTQALGRDEARNTTIIRNLSSTALDRVWIGSDQHTANSAYGFPLDPGAQVTLSTEDPIWIRRDGASPTNPIPCAILTEYTVHES